MRGSSVFDPRLMAPLIQQVREPLHLVRHPTGHLGIDASSRAARGDTRVGTLPPLYPEWLGDREFLQVHAVRFPYVVGEMAGGIASAGLVIAGARAGMLAFFGAAGVPIDRIARAIDEIEAALGPGASWGVNLIHSPSEPATEEATVDLLLARGVRRVSASAFMGITPAVVRYALHGIAQDPHTGAVRRPNHLFAKVSRPEVARHFMSPAPAAIVERLVAQGQLTAGQAQLAAHVPLAEDVTVEADSGGHTDNRPLTVALPLVQAVRDELCATYGYARSIRVGAAGGLGTPAAVAGAFALGAAYVLTGSVNQCTVEAGTSPEVKQLLAQVGMADVTMAPSADMFELGVKVQVVKRSTLFGARAHRLYEVYLAHDGLASIPAATRAALEREVFRQELDAVWEATRAYWLARDPAEVARAEREPKHQMALCFRAYLGRTSQWARAGDDDRRLDYQVWCGPAMGAFNGWVRGSFLEPVAQRTVGQVARNLLEGAAVVTRAQQLRSYGVAVPSPSFDFRPRPLH